MTDLRQVRDFWEAAPCAAGQRHRGALLDTARRLYPRWAVKRFLSGCGLYLLIEARRPAGPGGAP
jgi:hypothetical protein